MSPAPPQQDPSDRSVAVCGRTASDLRWRHQSRCPTLLMLSTAVASRPQAVADSNRSHSRLWVKGGRSRAPQQAEGLEHRDVPSRAPAHV